MLIAIGASAGVAGCETPASPKPAASAPATRHVGKFEFRLASRTETPGYESMSLEVPPGKTFVAPQSVLTADDVRDISVQKEESRGYVFTIRIEDRAIQKFADLTRANVKKQLAIVAGGKVLIAPTIEAEIPNGILELIGDRSAAEVERMRAVLMGEK